MSVRAFSASVTNRSLWNRGIKEIWVIQWQNHFNHLTQPIAPTAKHSYKISTCQNMRLFIFALTSALLVLSTAATPTPPLTSSLSLVNRALSNVTSTDPSITIIHTTKAAIPSSPISQAIVSGDHIYVSGYLPLAPVTGVIVGPGDVVQQTIAVLQNIKIVIEEAGSHLGKVVRVGLYLKNIEDYAVVNKAYAEFFGTHRPARTAFAVANIPLGVLVQIDAIVRL